MRKKMKNVASFGRNSVHPVWIF